MPQLTLLALALAALSPLASAGKAYIHNNCSTAVYLQRATPSGTGSTITLAAKTGSYSETISGMYISLKVSATAGGIENSLDYSLSTGEYGGLYYDLGQTQGYPFLKTGIKLVPSDSKCTAIDCKALPNGYTGSYPYSGIAATSSNPYVIDYCEGASDLTLTLCSGSS